MQNLKLYTVDTEYIRKLRVIDHKVPITVKPNSTNERPFLGVVLKIDSISYYVPLSSPKPKHLKMKNTLDFRKIDEGKLGAINFNNMIPVTDKEITEIDINRINDARYQSLLRNQLSWCNSKREEICKQAQRLHTLYINHQLTDRILDRTCNFPLLEEALNKE